jgi:hypothetical protein
MSKQSERKQREASEIELIKELPVNNNNGKKSPNPSPNKKKKKTKPKKNRAVWIAPIFFGTLCSGAVVLCGMAGHWNDWWVKFLFIPAALLIISFGAFEFLKIQLEWKNGAFLTALILAFLLFGLAFFAYKIALDDKWQPPELPKDWTRYASLSVRGIIGHCVVNKSVKKGIVEHLDFLDGCVVNTELKNNRIFVDAKIPFSYFGGGSNTFEINGNKVTGIPDDDWDVNFDQNAIEIVDNFRMPLVQIYYKSPSEIVIAGLPQSLPGIMPGGSLEPQTGKPTRIFKYPSYEFLGKPRDDQ